VRLVENIVATIVVLLAPASLIYCWWVYWMKMSGDRADWRGRFTLISMTLVSLVMVSWPTHVLFMPRIGSRLEQFRWVAVREVGAVAALLVALFLGLFGRPRLILPITLACMGIAIFWVMSTIP
jgi:uncharacterized membrane protein